VNVTAWQKLPPEKSGRKYHEQNYKIATNKMMRRNDKK